MCGGSADHVISYQRTTPKGRTAKVPLGQMPIIEVPFKRVGPIQPATSKGNRYILTVKPSKCFIGYRSLECLGHIAIDEKLRHLPEKATAIQNFNRPSTKKQV